MAFRSPETETPASMVPRSTVFTSLAARMIEFERRPPSPPGAPDFASPRPDFGVAAAADAGVPSPAFLEQALRTSVVAATITAGERRSETIDTSDESREISEKEVRERGALVVAARASHGRAPDLQP